MLKLENKSIPNDYHRLGSGPTEESIAAFKKKELNAQGCFNLVSTCITHACTPRQNPDSDNYGIDRKINRKFAESRLIDVYCDCTDNFEASRLRKIILKLNEFQYGVRK